jgi:hypothetical protein
MILANIFFRRVLAQLMIGAIAGILIGCGKSHSPAPTSATEAQASMQDAFKQAKPEVKAVADEVVSALQNNDSPKAYIQLHVLSGSSGLNEEQRDAATKSMLLLGQQLRQAAAKGDAEAEKALEMYRATK